MRGITGSTTGFRRFNSAIRLTALWAATSVGTLKAQDTGGTRRYDVGGFSLSLTCLGRGTPTVVFDGGAGTWSIHYRHLQDRLAETTRVCTYDRAGLGDSDPSPAARTSEDMAGELSTLLRAAGEAGPYVVVGHSLGGYNVRLFARRHPDEVVGMVLLEAGHERQFQRLPREVAAAIAGGADRFRGMAEAARAGTLPAQPIPDLPAFERHPELRDAYAKAIRRPTLYEAWAEELEGAPESAGQASRSGALGDLPLVIVTAGDSYAPYGPLGIPVDAANEAWQGLQAEFLDLSTDAVQMMAPDATHDIAITAPDLAVTAVERVVRAARRGSRVAAAPSEHGDGWRLWNLWDEYVAAINDRALDRLMTFFSPDAVLMPPNQPVVLGVSGAREWFHSLFRTPLTLEMPTLELQVVGDWAIRRGIYEIRLTLDDRGGEWIDSGKFIQVWERQEGGQWRIIRGILNSDLPAPPAAGR